MYHGLAVGRVVEGLGPGGQGPGHDPVDVAHLPVTAPSRPRHGPVTAPSTVRQRSPERPRPHGRSTRHDTAGPGCGGNRPRTGRVVLSLSLSLSTGRVALHSTLCFTVGTTHKHTQSALCFTMHTTCVHVF
jgi:hypothetical protein